MFSGIVEATASVNRTQSLQNAVQIFVQKPRNFDDVGLGDSISSSGVCLTVEKITADELQFSLGQETLNVTGWSAANLTGRVLNLERSLRLGDRIHGHLVSGHVDTTGRVAVVEKGDSWFVGFEIPDLDRRYVWTKGSITINGVSLTVNKISGAVVEVCLIPETLLRTNLNDLKPGDTVNVEYDYWAKAFVNFQEQREAAR